MKLMRMVTVLGIGAWIARKVANERAGRDDGSVRPTRLHGTRASGAAAASGAFRDDRDIAGVGVLRDEQTTPS